MITPAAFLSVNAALSIFVTGESGLEEKEAGCSFGAGAPQTVQNFAFSSRGALHELQFIDLPPLFFLLIL
jgi:hypothetical protein